MHRTLSLERFRHRDQLHHLQPRMVVLLERIAHVYNTDTLAKLESLDTASNPHVRAGI